MVPFDGAFFFVFRALLENPGLEEGAGGRCAFFAFPSTHGQGSGEFL